MLALDRLEEGVQKQEERAATFEATVGGKTVSQLVQFPGLTIDEVQALRNSKASSYNKTGGLPYTAIIDPFTEEELKSWQGGRVTKDEIMTCVTQARETLVKAHGSAKPRAKPRAELRLLADAAAAKKSLAGLLPRLRGTGLEKRAKDLQASLASVAQPAAGAGR